ncbi:hypothetical protein VTJ04DRAFT_9743 [Mycothermus thermophilus]|uniref:uncharacterized protein n=1 Tax=Humicola insolens TaxID=85995 RepID=UPI003743C7DE
MTDNNSKMQDQNPKHNLKANLEANLFPQTVLFICPAQRRTDPPAQCTPNLFPRCSAFPFIVAAPCPDDL